jgi:hypothetical protein
MLSGHATLMHVDHSIQKIHTDVSFVHLTTPNLAMSSYFKLEPPESTRQEFLALKCVTTFCESRLNDHSLIDDYHFEFDHLTAHSWRTK